MTLDELREGLTAIVRRQLAEEGNSDIEVDHSEADRLLLEFIGDHEVWRLFGEIEMWYA
jgi:hypothetical protein